MQQRRLGSTDLMAPVLTLGTMTFGGQADAAASRSMVDLALARGVNFLDTANVYNAGRTEELLGEIIAGRRDRFLIASKVGIKLGDAADDQGLSPAAIRNGGLLAGKHSAAAPLADSRFTRTPIYKDRAWHEANFAAIQS